MRQNPITYFSYLDKEPLVAGADTLLEIVSNERDSSVIIFSAAT